MPKVIVGMSGGVDSSVAAYLLTKEGYNVEGVSFLMWESNKESGSPACCSLRATDLASKTARFMGISHRIVDARQDFREKVVEPFMKAYLSGLTPNPCILCNRFIKFPYLLTEAERRNAAYVSTGHYARVERQGSRIRGFEDSGPDSDLNRTAEVFLRKGIDPKKDQSYVLYTLGQDVLARLILPLGNYKKDAVKKMAEELGLPAAESSESQEICFVEEKNYLSFLENFAPEKAEPGPIVGLDGKRIGTHKGIHGYTVGQRKGLGISSPEPLYVIGTDTLKNTVFVGPREAARKKEFVVGELNWIVHPDPSFSSFRVSVKVRSTMKEEPATVYAADRKAQSDVRVVFDEPQWAPAPGQSAVFYDGDTVIGGGVIKRQA